MSSRPRKKQQREQVTATYQYEHAGDSSSAATPADGDDDDDDDLDDLDDLPVEGGSIDEQVLAILEGSSDEEIVQILGQIPAMDDGMKLLIGMQKLSPAAPAFVLLQPVADACSNAGIVALFTKIGSLAEAQMNSDIGRVFEDNVATATALMSHPPELRRRRFFLSLAAGYVDLDDETWATMHAGMQQMASN